MDTSAAREGLGVATLWVSMQVAVLGFAAVLAG
jgi:hypothetical protein